MAATPSSATGAGTAPPVPSTLTPANLPAQTSSLDAFVELRPLPLVALVGRTDLHGALTARDPPADELHARYLSLPVDCKLLDHHPDAADGKNAVLKRDWLYKHTYLLPGVVSLWCAWDADTSAASILSQIEALRARCRPSCKIVLVLVQRPTAAQGPLSPAVKDDDRLSQLRKSADLDSKSLLSLMQVEGEGAGSKFDEGTTRRVERALLEAALAYYKDESRHSAKASKVQQAKVLLPHLLARQHLKRGYYSEVRRDFAATSPARPAGSYV